MCAHMWLCCHQSMALSIVNVCSKNVDISRYKDQGYHGDVKVKTLQREVMEEKVKRRQEVESTHIHSCVEISLMKRSLNESNRILNILVEYEMNVYTSTGCNIDVSSIYVCWNVQAMHLMEKAQWNNTAIHEISNCSQ